MLIAETPRLRLRQLCLEDAPFIRELLMDPAWKRFIGDRGELSLEQARSYLETGPIASYARHGHGLWLCELRDTAEPIGICGLIRREGLSDVDLGFAFMPAYRGRGYAREAAEATLSYGFAKLLLPCIVAITSPDNARSAHLLEQLGFVSAGQLTVAGRQDCFYRLEAPV